MGQGEGATAPEVPAEEGLISEGAHLKPAARWAAQGEGGGLESLGFGQGLGRRLAGCLFLFGLEHQGGLAGDGLLPQPLLLLVPLPLLPKHRAACSDATDQGHARQCPQGTLAGRWGAGARRWGPRGCFGWCVGARRRGGELELAQVDGLGAEVSALAQSRDFGIDRDAQAFGHPPRLGNHKHRLRQFAGVARLQGGELLEPHVQPSGQGANAQTFGLAGLAEGLTEVEQGRRGTVGHRVRDWAGSSHWPN